MPKISVIIPVYNVEKYLKECLDSVVNQTLNDIEIICINDGSTDGSLKILEEYASKDKRITIINQENQGQGVAKNKGIDISTGEYIAFIDPDDFLDLDTLEIVYNKFLGTKVDIIQFDYQTCTEKGDFVEEFPLSINSKKNLNFQLKNGLIFNWQNIKKKNLSELRLCATDKIYSSKLIKENNIKFAPTKNGEDHPFAICTSLLANNILYLNQYFYHYRIREDSAIHKLSDDNFAVFDNIRILKDFLIKNNLFTDYEKAYRDYLLEAFSLHYTNIPEKNIDTYLNMCKEILSVNEYKKLLKGFEPKFTLLQRIFSVKNHKIKGKKHKILCFLGIKFILKTTKEISNV